MILNINQTFKREKANYKIYLNDNIRYKKEVFFISYNIKFENETVLVSFKNRGKVIFAGEDVIINTDYIEWITYDNKRYKLNRLNDNVIRLKKR